MNKVYIIILSLLAVIIFLYSDLVGDNLTLIGEQREYIAALLARNNALWVERDTVVVRDTVYIEKVLRDTVEVVVRDTVRVSLLGADARAALDRLGIAFTAEAFIDSARAGNLEVVRLFVVSGMDIDAKNNDGRTALDLAAWWGHLEVVRYLVVQGADVNAADKWGWTALHWAAFEGHLSVVVYLVGQGVSLTATNKYGWTALHSAAYWGRLLVVKHLVEQGASVTATSNGGLTAKDLASKEGRPDIADYLGSQGG